MEKRSTARKELVVEVADVASFRISCSNRDCWATLTYRVEALPESFPERCPACLNYFPKSLITAIEHYSLFFKNAAEAESGRMILRVEI
jgi:hypothetical protein